jgi:hypothetical protein
VAEPAPVGGGAVVVVVNNLAGPRDGPRG